MQPSTGIASQPTSGELVQLLGEIIQSGRCIGDLVSFPMMLLRQEWLPTEQEEGKPLPIAERVLRWFRSHGFRGDRTRMNIEGYPGFFRKLFAPPPWIEVNPEDCDDNIPEERALELRPLYQQCAEQGPQLADALNQFFEERSQHLTSSFTMFPGLRGVEEQLLRPVQRQELEEQIRFVQLVGTDVVERLREAVFEYYPDIGWDDMTAKPGSPDLFIWHPDLTLRLWFFVEVKSWNDHLQPTQTAWIRSHWEAIGGRVMVFSVTER